MCGRTVTDRSVTPLTSLLQTVHHQLKFQERRPDLNLDNPQIDAHACEGTLGTFQLAVGDKTTNDQVAAWTVP